MTSRFILVFLFVFGSYAYAQQGGCKVLIPEISESYSGRCKDGLAHGKGIAKGIDFYEGRFIRGLPEGKGTYKWADGTFYEGQWKNGKKEGKGKMVYRDSIIIGYWKVDEYQGEDLVRPYEVQRSINLARSTITKSISPGNGVRIKLMAGGSENRHVEEFSLAYDSGIEEKHGTTYTIKNADFPLYVKIMYITWNKLQTFELQVLFELKINEPGMWDVVLNN